MPLCFSLNGREPRMVRLSTVSASNLNGYSPQRPVPVETRPSTETVVSCRGSPHPRPHTSIFPLFSPSFLPPFPLLWTRPRRGRGVPSPPMRISGFSGSSVSVCSNQAFGFDWNPSTVRVSVDHDDGGGFARDTTTKQRARAAHTNGACCDPTNAWRCG